ncbi:hypothetical protein ES703_109733 [subsurface metagenome]
MKGGHISPVEFLGRGDKDFFLRRTGLHLALNQLYQLNHSFFAFAEHEQVNELSRRFAAVCHTAACNYQWLVFVASSAADIQAAEVEHIEHVGIAKLAGQAEADDIKTCQRRFGFQTK